jgi:hypothetical protein
MERLALLARLNRLLTGHSEVFDAWRLYNPFHYAEVQRAPITGENLFDATASFTAGIDRVTHFRSHPHILAKEINDRIDQVRFAGPGIDLNPLKYRLWMFGLSSDEIAITAAYYIGEGELSPELEKQLQAAGISTNRTSLWPPARSTATRYGPRHPGLCNDNLHDRRATMTMAGLGRQSRRKI